jgi:hypothetical protein
MVVVPAGYFFVRLTLQKIKREYLKRENMEYFSEDKDFVNAECEHCKRVLKIKREQAIPNPTGFSLNPPGGVRCFCGAVHHSIAGTTQTLSGMSGMVCPHCQTRGAVTTKVVKRKKGVSGAKATGAVLTLGWSLLVTGLSRKEEETEAHCTACGATWHFS